MGDGRRNVESITGHHHATRNDVLLNLTVRVPDGLNLNGEFTLEHPCICIRITSGPIVIDDDDIQFPLDDSLRSKTPINFRRHVKFKHAVVFLNNARRLFNQQSAIDGFASVVNRCVAKAKLLIVAQLDSDFAQIAKAVGVDDLQFPTNRLRGLQPEHGWRQQVCRWLKEHEFALAGCARCPACMSVLRSGKRDGIACDVRTHEQNPCCLKVGVAGVVDRDVDEPSMFVVLCEKGSLLVFLKL